MVLVVSLMMERLCLLFMFSILGGADVIIRCEIFVFSSLVCCALSRFVVGRGCVIDNKNMWKKMDQPLTTITKPQTKTSTTSNQLKNAHAGTVFVTVDVVVVVRIDYTGKLR
eukprot:m.97787 g.97787  ORF g.97787 m.97787 type:complete len:112 (-) comp27010_c1_seq1:1614-1949(-)